MYNNKVLGLEYGADDYITKPFSLRELLAAGKAIHRDDLISRVWGIDYDITTRTVDNFILKLRQKIEADSHNHKIILTVHGIGYKMILG